MIWPRELVKNGSLMRRIDFKPGFTTGSCRPMEVIEGNVGVPAWFRAWVKADMLLLQVCCPGKLLMISGKGSPQKPKAM